ncbi:hypothetical protein A2W14_03045 [Candidatus Gottesmanbacteria bacterium RBG_16_37_8]|uniref:Uncharacterized protein n=1 Tax=Candidatus Gottesmanbacteria bacterium RBG_16_37_8 TaxID=1798371 RepID=A0A1F5YTX4_9BACT|nr:MAG: hypothetical protein A2W14_03045 [Candidatus Gottesmanbacteria bacterium RBG_16_37_8]
MSKLFNNLILNIYSKFSSIKNTRYVRCFVLIKEEFEPGRSNLQSKEEEKIYNDLEQSKDNLVKILHEYPVIKELKETIFMVVKDLNDLKFTVDINNGDIKLSIGWHIHKKHTLILPLYKHNIEHLKEITSKGELSLDDIYRFVRVLFIPFLKGLYQADYSNLPKDKSYMQLDNFIHVEVVPEHNIEVEGFPGPARATVVNVDGQWLVFEGFQGNPDIKYSMNIKQALEFAYLLKVKILQHAKDTDIIHLMPVINKYNDLKKAVQIYERKWHSIEELD